LALSAPILPLFLFWRSAVLSMVVLLIGRLLDTPTASYEDGIADLFGRGLVGLIILGVLIASFARLLVAAIGGNLTLANLSGPNFAWRRSADLGILAVCGGAIGLLTTICLAYTLGGVAGGVGLDLGIAFGAIVISIGSIFLKHIWIKLPLATACGAIAAIALYGSLQTSRIVTQVTRLANNQPICFVIAPHGDPVGARGQFGFFSLPKGRNGNHLGLFIQSTHTFERVHWSIRQQRFMAGIRDTDFSCDVKTDLTKFMWSGHD